VQLKNRKYTERRVIAQITFITAIPQFIFCILEVRIKGTRKMMSVVPEGLMSVGD